MASEDGLLYQEFMKTWTGAPKGTPDLKRAAAWVKYRNKFIRRYLKK